MSLIAATASVWIAGRLVDRRPFSEFGLRPDRGWWLDFGFGIVLGALLTTGVFSAELALGWVTITDSFVFPGGGPSLLAVISPIVRFSCVGLYEELIYRSYQIRNLTEGLKFCRWGPVARYYLLVRSVQASSVWHTLRTPTPPLSAPSTSRWQA